jgi:tRNA splicing ligase
VSDLGANSVKAFALGSRKFPLFFEHSISWSIRVFVSAVLLCHLEATQKIFFFSLGVTIPFKCEGSGSGS